MSSSTNPIRRSCSASRPSGLHPGFSSTFRSTASWAGVSFLIISLVSRLSCECGTVALESRRLNAALGRARAADLGPATRGVPSAPTVDVHCSRTRSISQPWPAPSGAGTRDRVVGYHPTGLILLARWRQDRLAGNGILGRVSTGRNATYLHPARTQKPAVFSMSPLWQGYRMPCIRV